jgi:hypothetical protein
MKLGLTNTLPILEVLLLSLPLSACHSFTFFYNADAIEGRVVDAETSKPLEGVIAVAHWRLNGGFEGGTPISEVQILEAVTDPNGRYSFPAWGPRFASTGYLEEYAPSILFFKSGYKFVRVTNDHWYPGRDMSKSDWNGRTVKLERFRGTLPDYAQHMGFFNDELWTAGYAVRYHSGDPCGWKSFPKMLKAMDELDEQLKPLRMHRTVAAQLRAAEVQLRAAGCGTVADLLGK